MTMFFNRPISIVSVFMAVSLTSTLTRPIAFIKEDGSTFNTVFFWMILLGVYLVSLCLSNFLWDILPTLRISEVGQQRVVVVTHYRLDDSTNKYIVALEGVYQGYTYDLDKALAMALSLSNTHGVYQIKFELGKF